MNQNNQKEYLRVKRYADVYTDTSAEYSLPDYKTDVRKLLFTEARVRPAGKFVGDGEVEFSGIVEYNVIYSDSEGDISSASFTSDYDYSVKCAADGLRDAISDTRVSNFAIRLVGPRKISAKASVVGSATVCENDSIEVDGSAFYSSESAETLERVAMVRETGQSAPMEREYAEELISLDGAIADEVQVIYSGAQVVIDEVTAEEGGARLVGKMRMYAVLRNGDAPAYFVQRETPIDEVVPFESAEEYARLIPRAETVSVRADINATENGTDVIISSIIEFSVRGEKNRHVSLICDAYMQKCVTENVYSDFNYSEYIDTANLSDTVTTSIPRDEMELGDIREIVYMSATPKIEAVDIADSVATISGEVRFCGVVSAMQEDNKVAYQNVKMTAKFDENVNINCQNAEKTTIEPKVIISNVKTNIDQNNIYSSCDLTLHVDVTEEKGMRILSECNAREDLPFEKTSAKIIVYYPEEGETVFSIAKRFHTSVARVAEQNSLLVGASADGSELSLGGVKKLIIT